MSGAGKGDNYRAVNKKKFDSNYERAFGDRDPLRYQKGLKYSTKDKSKKT